MENTEENVLAHGNGTPANKVSLKEQSEPPGKLLPDSFPIIVIGASAGGLDALRTLVAGLPKDLGASLFIVWHISPNVPGVLPYILNKTESLYAANAYDGEPIVKNRIYVAPPDHHLLVEEGRLRVTKGPKENRFRPAVDPLFRSAAYAYNGKVIGIVLSGSLDDGTAGLWTIKHRGGTAIVQNPLDAEVPSMPENAAREVEVDYSVPMAEMSRLLTRLVKEQTEKHHTSSMEKDDKTETEIRIAKEENAMKAGVMQLGEHTPFTCPDCHGVLSAIKEGKLRRYRCHTGHAYSPDSLLAALTDNIEEDLWNVIRSIEESTMMLNHIGDHFAESNNTKLAAQYFKKAKEAEQRSEQIKQLAFSHEQLSQNNLEEEAENEEKKSNL